MLKQILSPKRYGKIWRTYLYLLELQALGKGSDTLMICYPNAPFHYVTKSSLWEIDGIPEVRHYQEKVYDYPIKPIDGWITLYETQGYFVK